VKIDGSRVVTSCWILLVLEILGCSDGSNSNSNSGVWWTATCSQLNGKTSAQGACVVDCSTSTSGGCPESTTCGGNLPNNSYHQYCMVSTCSVASDCGTSGWYCSDGWCRISCTVDTNEAQSTECPTGYSCISDFSSSKAFCVRHVNSSSCGSCGTSGSSGSCCGGLFCSGSCVGSPCC